jgi:HemY protein
MIRWGIFLVVIGLVALAAGWLAGHPGEVTLEWQNYQVTTSVAVLIAAVLLFAGIVALLYRLWWTLLRAPRLLGRARRDRRQRRGFEALSRGMVAVAAGDAEAARRQAQRANRYLDDPPLTMLLSAQAAQMEGDEKAAEKYFTAMSERRATEFLGVRGLLNLAIKRQNWDEALSLARRAYRMNPKSEWVVKVLYDLQKRTNHWAEAAVTVDEAARLKVLPSGDAQQEKAEIYYRRSLQESGFDALKWARKAARECPGYVPATIRWAQLLIADGRHRKAVGVVEEAWQRNPDPELAEMYWKARQVNDAMQKLEAAQRLADHNPDHLESRLIVAVAALEAHKWGEARAALEPVASEHAPPRVCRLMAQLEEAEHGDLVRAREWLMRATADEHGPQMSSTVIDLEHTPAAATTPAPGLPGLATSGPER